MILQNQPISIMHEIHQHVEYLDDFHQTDFYQDTKEMFSNHNIHFLQNRDVKSAPNSIALLTKIRYQYQAFSNDTKCIVQFPVLLIDEDIQKLKELNFHSTFPNQSIWIQCFYSEFYKCCINKN